MTDISVKIKRLHPDAVIPQYATDGSAGFDLVAVEDVIISPGDTVLVRTGLAFEIPVGYEMQIRPRSGISLRTKLRVANAPGTVDEDFRGEVAVIFDNISLIDDIAYGKCYGFINGNFSNTVHGKEYVPYLETPNIVHNVSYIIRKGDRIAQGVIAPVYRAVFTEVDELGETERGNGGFGHSGVRAKEGEN